MLSVATLAHELGGAAYVSAAVAGRLVPAGLASAASSGLLDRLPRRSVLVGSAALRAVLLAVLATVVAVDGPVLLMLLLTGAEAAVATVHRPVHVALLPALARTPSELSSANVTTSTTDYLGFLLGSLLGGFTAQALGFPVALAAAATAILLSAAAGLLVPDVRRARPRSGGDELGRHSDGLRTVLSNPDLRRLTIVHAANRASQSLLDVLLVVLALEALDVGTSGVGILNALWAAGGLATGIVVNRVGVGSNGRILAVALLAAGFPLSGLGLVPGLAGAGALLAVVGGGYVLTEVGTVAMTQRLTDEELLGRVFGLHETVSVVGGAIGAALAPVLLAGGGPTGALAVTAVLLPSLFVAFGPGLRALGASVMPAPEDYAALRSLPMFSSMPVATVETLALKAAAVTAAPGEVIVRSGEPGDALYVVTDGELRVADGGGHELRRLGAGDVMGEIALVQDRPRTATVTAVRPTTLLRVDRLDFLRAVDGHARSRGLANDLAADRLGDADPADG